MKSQLSLFKTRRFLPLFIVQFFGAFNDNAFKNALVIWCTYDVALKLNLDPKLIVTIASCLFILPFFIMSFLAGQLADKYEKSQIIRNIKKIEILLMSLIFLGFYFENIYFLLLLIFLMGAQSTFFGPLKYSLLPENLKDDELISGNALIEGGTFLAILFGTIFGGIAISGHYGVEVVCSFLILFGFVGYFSSKFIPKSPIGDSKLALSFNVFTQTKKIVNYAKKQEEVWLSVLGISWFWFVGIIFLSQIPTYTNEIVRGSEHVVTMFLSIFSVGMAIGSVMCNKLLKGEVNGRLIPYGSAGMTISILIFVVASYLYHNLTLPFSYVGIQGFITSGGYYSFAIIMSLFSLSIFSGIYTVPLYAIMQDRSQDKYISRIIAAHNVINSLFMVVASIVVLLLLLLNFNLLEIFLMLGVANIFVFFFIRKTVKNKL